MNRIIVAFVGQNQNGILRHLSQGLMQLLEPSGYQGAVIDLADPGWPDQFDALLQQGIAMAWGHAGVGARLEVDGQCFWDRVKIPFVSVLADPPCWRPCNHAAASRYVVNGYLYAEWLAVQRRLVRSKQLSALIHCGIVPNPLRDRLAWADRSHRMVLVKTGGDPAVRQAGWASLPRRLRAVVGDAASLASHGGPGDVTDTVLAAMEAHGLAPEERTDITFALMTEIDLFVRETRSTALVRALLDVPADIYGSGWDHIDGSGRRARFHPAFDAAGLPALYAATQFMLNTTPNFASGVHERVAYALDARCCVVSDQNAYMREHLAGIPTFFGIDPSDPALADRLHAIYQDPTDYTGATQPGVDLTARRFDGRRFMHSLLELAKEAATAEQFAGYRHAVAA